MLDFVAVTVVLQTASVVMIMHVSRREVWGCRGW